MTAVTHERAEDDAERGIEAIIGAGSVAVVGSAARPGPARKVIDNLRRVSFAGALSVVSRSDPGTGDPPVYRSLQDLPASPDVVVVAVSSVATVPVVAEAAAVG
ncbi:MAG: CoA-binding protein, partial [Acidimicrobiales bacterium]